MAGQEAIAAPGAEDPAGGKRPEATAGSGREQSEAVKLLGFMAMALGMVMAFLDIQIVTSSLNDIQGGLSASPDEISWIQTSYLIAETVMIPISGWLGGVLSTRVLFTASAIGFTVSSVACSLAWDIWSMVIFRAMQGFVGGAMIPLAFSSGFALYPGRRSAMVPAVLGMVATVAPTMGPTLGGWITQTYSWPWLFYVNVVPGIIIVVVVPFAVRVDEPNRGLLRGFDALSIPFIALSLGCLVYVLEEGVRDDWFDDQTITTLTVVSVISSMVVIWRGVTHPNPVLDLRSLRHRNFGLGCLYSLVLGIGNQGSVFLIPVFLARVRGYNSLDIGEAVLISGVAQVISTACVVALSNRIDPRLMLGAGVLMYGASLLFITPMNNLWNGPELFWALALRGFASMFVIVPITTFSLGSLPPQRLKMASGLYNLTRNLGGGIGIACIGILIQQRTALHYTRIAETVTVAKPSVLQALDLLSSRFGDFMSDPGRADVAALAVLTQFARREALVMAIADVLVIMSTLFFSLMLLLPLLRWPPSPSAVSPRKD